MPRSVDRLLSAKKRTDVDRSGFSSYLRTGYSQKQTSQKRCSTNLSKAMSIMSATIYRLDTRFVVHPVNTTTAGVGIASEPYIVLPTPTSAVDLGTAINHALDSYRNGIPHPTNWKGLSGPRLAAAGVRSEAALHKQALMVEVTRAGNTLTFTPQRNGGATGNDKGFHALDERAVTLDEPTQEAAGEAVLRVFNLCT
jgi:hypothetical protein